MAGSRLDKRLERGSSAASQGEKHELKVPLLLSLFHYNVYAYYLLSHTIQQVHNGTSSLQPEQAKRTITHLSFSNVLEFREREKVSDRMGAKEENDWLILVKG